MGSEPFWSVLFALVALSFAPQAPVRLVLGGDVMLNGISPARNPLAGISSTLKEADAAIVNLEIPLTRSTTRTNRKTAEEIKRRDQWVLKADPKHAKHLASAGIDIVGLGNNHSMDYGLPGLEEMTKNLNQQSILFAGAGLRAAAERAAVYRTAGGVRVGLLSTLAFVTTGAMAKCTPATATSPGVAALDLGGSIGKPARLKLARWVATAKKQCDILVVGVHWGVERKSLPRPYQVDLGRALVDAGADVVWGHHPHVLQGAEIYKEKPIFYSLGNLVSSKNGVTALARLEFNQGKLRNLEWLPAMIEGGATRMVTGNQRVGSLKEMASLHQSLRSSYPHPSSRSVDSFAVNAASKSARRQGREGS